MKKIPLTKILTFLYIISCLDFFEPTFLPAILPVEFVKNQSVIFKACQCILFLALALITIKKKIPKNHFTVPFIIIVSSILCSTIMATTMHEGQTLVESIRSTLPRLLVFGSFFLLCKIQPSIKKTENIIIFFGLFSALLVIQIWLLFPNILFGYFAIAPRGIRMTVSGDTFKIALLFLSLNMIMYKREKKFVFFLIICVTSVILGIVRQILAITSVLCIFFIMRNTTLPKKILISIVILFVFVGITKTETYNNLLNYTKEEAYNDRGGENIRITAFKYYVNDKQKNLATRILGNGEFAETSAYGKACLLAQRNTLCFPTDVGWAYFYHIYGIFGVVGLLMIFYRTYKISIPFRYLYLKYSIYYLMLAFIASGPLLYYTQAIALPFLCYLIEQVHSQYKVEQINETAEQ